MTRIYKLELGELCIHNELFVKFLLKDQRAMLRLRDIMHEDEVATICRRDISEEGEDKLIFEPLLSRG